MEWALDIAVRHPALSRAIVSPNDEWLDVLLEDGRTFRFRPAALVDPDAPEPERTERLTRLIEIGARNAVVATISDNEPEAAPESGAPDLPSDPHILAGDTFNPSDEPYSDIHDDTTPLVLPIVRRADYFLASHHPDRDDSIVYLPLTDFIGIGIAEDQTDTIQPLFFSHLEERGVFDRTINEDLGSLFGRAVDNLRKLNLSAGKSGVELAVTLVAGARVYTFTSPADYQSSWFGDLDIIQQVAESLAAEYPGNLPLFVPASRTNLFIVFADDPHLPDFFALLRGHTTSKDSLYPLPHTVSSDGWREWIPFPDHPAASILEDMRTAYRARVYEAQVAQMTRSPQHDGVLKEYTVRHLKGGRHISVALWRDTDERGSIPQTDFIAFVRQPSEPWDDGDFVTIRSHIAREIWAVNMRKMGDVWPSRWEINGFPNDEVLAQLREATHRPL